MREETNPRVIEVIENSKILMQHVPHNLKAPCGGDHGEAKRRLVTIDADEIIIFGECKVNRSP